MSRVQEKRVQQHRWPRLARWWKEVVSVFAKIWTQVRRFLSPIAAVILGVALWRILAVAVNQIVHIVLDKTIWLPDVWQRRQGAAVLVATLLISLWVAFRMIYPPETFD
jgi:hypothetical protein